MAEDVGLCTAVRHHQQKLVLFLAAMRGHADALGQAGFPVDYRRLDVDGGRPLVARLEEAMAQGGHDHLVHFEIEDRGAAQAVDDLVRRRDVDRTVLDSPGFLTTRSQFGEFLADQDKPRMDAFYRLQRRRLGLLLEPDGEPRGGRWSFDSENRKRLPRSVEPPDLPDAPADDHVEAAIQLVRQHFGDHPGDARQFAWPTTREAAMAWLDDFLAHRLGSFGPYQDAFTPRHTSLFHSALSPVINLGLLTPDEVLERTLASADDAEVPLASLEGFVRQLAGWREYVRGIYHHLGEEQEQANAWKHEAELGEAWYRGDTGIPPLDDAIGQALDTGWTHHIQRLMVLANVMNLVGIAPRSVHRWFMETHIDSADWVMGPNVYGMGLASDGGRMVTKPYVCGSNYWLKMSDYPRGDWCDGIDGLYWQFIDRHRTVFSRNPRTSMTTRTLDRLDASRRRRIFKAADALRERLVA